MIRRRREKSWTDEGDIRINQLDFSQTGIDTERVIVLDFGVVRCTLIFRSDILFRISKLVEEVFFRNLKIVFRLFTI